MRLKDTGLTAQELKDMVNKYMVETYERYDFIAERAEGMYLYDEEGNAYLDFYGGVAVNSCGNRNPKVIAAIKDQLDDIMHTFNYPYTIPQALLLQLFHYSFLRCLLRFLHRSRDIPHHFHHTYTCLLLSQQGNQT